MISLKSEKESINPIVNKDVLQPDILTHIVIFFFPETTLQYDKLSALMGKSGADLDQKF